VPPSGRKDSARLQDPHGWYRRLDADPRVAAYSPQLTAQVIVTRARASANGTLIGSVPEKRERVTNLRAHMIEGRLADVAGGGNRLVGGIDLLTKVGARIGSTVNVTSGRGAPVPFKVVGSFRLGVKQLDESLLFGDLPDVQSIMASPSQVNEIAVRLKDVSQARAIATDWQNTTREKVQSWDQSNANVLSVFRIQDFVRFTMVTIILLVAGFGIYNILNMLVSQKRREIAILRSMGYLPSEVLFLFFIQGVILGLIGGALGCAVGYVSCLYLQTVPFNGPELGTGRFLISFSPLFYIGGFVMAVVASAIASLLPARSAGRMTPVEIIRSE
jgi:lipoprotein-releasing system permease protein